MDSESSTERGERPVTQALSGLRGRRGAPVCPPITEHRAWASLKPRQPGRTDPLAATHHSPLSATAHELTGNSVTRGLLDAYDIIGRFVSYGDVSLRTSAGARLSWSDTSARPLETGVAHCGHDALAAFAHGAVWEPRRGGVKEGS